MKQMRTSPSARDEVDRIVDELLDDPSRAEDMKQRLRRHLGAASGTLRRPAAAAPAEPDDLWENLPV
jgi:plasmid stabilization system protein ParE